MNKKLVIKIFKIVLLIIIILAIVYSLFWYFNVKYDTGGGPLSGFGHYDDYGEYVDPCAYEPGQPDPCGGS